MLHSFGAQFGEANGRDGLWDDWRGKASFNGGVFLV